MFRSSRMQNKSLALQSGEPGRAQWGLGQPKITPGRLISDAQGSKSVMQTSGMPAAASPGAK